MFRSLLIGAVVISLAVLSGSSCEKKDKAKQEVSKETVMCAKCQATWVKVPVYGTGRNTGEVVAYTKEKQACPECQAAAEKYFKTGVMDKCKSCGESLIVCKQQAAR